MPEEVNRIVADHVSDQLYTPTDVSRGNLLREGIEESKVFVTGNTVVDAVRENLEYSKKRLAVKEMGLSPGKFFLVTLHRAENVDNEFILRDLVTTFIEIKRKYGLPIVFPIHPRTSKKMREFGISNEGLDIIAPAGYLDFLQLEREAKLILTDSGGVQEEACCLNVPCVTLRDSTERPETVSVGANMIVGREHTNILAGVEQMLGATTGWSNPYGDGLSAIKIIETIGNIYD
jgi:UDP-N-acetylglucosamine 2-epimerase (non-hydrolysing)